MATHVEMLKFQHLKPKHDTDEEECIPSPRSGHRIVVNDSSLFSIGGYNPDFGEVENTEETYYPLFRELWKFNLTTHKWSLQKTTGVMPVELASHSAALLQGHHLLVYGGTGVPFGYMASNMLNVCNLATLEWSQVTCKGDPPTRSYGHAMVLVDECLYVFGGTTGWQYNADLYCLRLQDRTWEQLQSVGDSNPPGRYRHEVAYFDKKLHVFGGGRTMASYKMEKIPIYNFEDNTWTFVTTQPDPKHSYPAARRCHSCVQLDKDVYICGGYNGTEIFGDLWRLNLAQLLWTKLCAELPKPVYFHSASITWEGYMVVYGGVTKIDCVRSSDVLGIWVRIPSLKNLTWQTLKLLLPKITQLSTNRLRELGVPADLIDRLR